MLIARLVERNAEAHGALQNMLQQHFDHELAAGNWRSVKMLARLFGELARVRLLAAADVLAVLASLVAAVADPVARLERRDLFAYLVLAAMPWVCVVFLYA